MKTRKVYWLSFLMGVLLLLSGAGQAAGVTIRWWVWMWDNPWQQETWTASAQAFEQRTGIKVQIENVVWDQISDKLRAAVIAGNPPDVVMILRSDTYWLAEAGLLSDLTELAKAEIDLADFRPGTIEDVTVNGRIYAIPWRRDGYSLAVNTEILQKVGILYPPNTLDEVKAYAARVVEALPGVYGWGMCLGKKTAAFYRWENVFYSYGGDWLTPDGKSVAPNFLEAATKAFEFHAEMAKYAPPSALQDTDDDVLRLAAAGKIAMWQEHLSGWRQAQGLFTPEMLAHVQWVYFPEGKFDPATRTSYRYTGTGGWNIAIPKGAPNFQAAWEFVKYWTSPENMGACVLTLPARISAMEHPRIAAIPEAFKFGALKPTLTGPFVQDIRTLVWEQLQAVVLGTVTPQKAAETVYAKLNELLGK